MANGGPLENLISTIESGRRHDAMRFEHGLYGKIALSYITPIKRYNDCSYSTAQMIGATSWGLFQIMGYNVYSLGFSGTINDYLNDVGAQRQYFQYYCTRRGIYYTVQELKTDAKKRLNFAEHYNGPGAIHEYADRILAAIQGNK